MKYWEIIADKLSASGWSWGCSSQIDSTGRVLFTADAHRDDGKRFIVSADEQLTAFLELEESDAMTVIEVKPHRNGWKVFEAPGVDPIFLGKDQAINYAHNRASFRSTAKRHVDAAHTLIPCPRLSRPKLHQLKSKG
jgi:hypothetical protein